LNKLIKYSERILKQQNISQEQICAYHESGHVTICYLFKLKYTKVSIVKDPITNEQGFVDTPDMTFDSETFKKWGHIKTYGLIIIQYFAGIISEAFLCGKYNWDKAQHDLDYVNKVANDHDICSTKDDLWILAEKLVIKHWGLIDYLANNLLEKEEKELTNCEVENLLHGVKIRKRPPALLD